MIFSDSEEAIDYFTQQDIDEGLIKYKQVWSKI